MIKGTSLLLLALGGWIVMITWASVAPGVASDLAGAEFLSAGWIPVVFHFIAYGGLALLGNLWLTATRDRVSLFRPSEIGTIFVVVVGYGIAMEMAQTFVPGRTPSVMDVAVNASGALLALVLMGAIRSARVRHNSRRGIRAIGLRPDESPKHEISIDSR